MTPFRRAAAVHSPFAPELRDAVAQGSAFLRQEVEVAFAPEIEAAAPGDRRRLVDTLAAATSWGVWDGLRADAGDTPEQARVVLSRLLTAVLAGPNAPG